MNNEPESPNTRSNAKGRSTKHHKLVSGYKPQRGEGGKLKTGKTGRHEDQRPLTGAREGGGRQTSRHSTEEEVGGTGRKRDEQGSKRC